jgi:hypothetical protein
MDEKDEELTTVQITKRASRLLAQLARAYKRSKSGQLEFMVDVEAQKLESVKLLPAEVSDLKPVDRLAA